MKLQELADMLDKNIVVTKYANQNDRWSAKIEGVEVKDGTLLISVSGEAHCPETALLAYAVKLKGKTIVTDAMSENRITVLVPKTLEY